MRILVVAPWAPSVTRPRSMGFIKHLAEHNEVVVVGAAWNSTDLEELINLPVQRVIPVKMNKPGAYIRCLSGLLRGRSLQQAYVDSNKLRLVIRRTIAEFGPDLGFFNVIRSAQFSNEFRGVPLIIDLDEFRSGYYSLLSETSRNPLWRFIAKVEAKRMREAEKQTLKDFDRVIVSSPTDLSGHDGAKIRLVRSPHAIDSRRSGRIGANTDLEIIFVGRQSYRANAEAISWFVQEVMPEVSRRIPGCHLSIVGDAPPRNIRQLESPSVSVTGRVDDVAEYYASAALSIIPVTMATGVQMKLIESMVMGTPVVATPIVARGAGIDERHCYIAQTRDEWVHQVVRALSDKAESNQRSESAKCWADVEYSTASITGSLDESLAGLVVRDGHAGRF